MRYISYMYGQRRRQKAKSGQTQRILSTGIYLLSRATLFFHRKSGEIRERVARFNRRFSWPSKGALIFHPAPPVGRWLKLRSAEVLRNFDMDGTPFRVFPLICFFFPQAVIFIKVYMILVINKF